MTAHWTFSFLHPTSMVLSYFSKDRNYSIWMGIYAFVAHPIGLCVVAVMMARLWLLFFSYFI